MEFSKILQEGQIHWEKLPKTTWPKLPVFHFMVINWRFFRWPHSTAFFFHFFIDKHWYSK